MNTQLKRQFDVYQLECEQLVLCVFCYNLHINLYTNMNLYTI